MEYATHYGISLKQLECYFANLMRYGGQSIDKSALWDTDLPTFAHGRKDLVGLSVNHRVYSACTREPLSPLSAPESLGGAKFGWETWLRIGKIGSPLTVKTPDGSTSSIRNSKLQGFSYTYFNQGSCGPTTATLSLMWDITKITKVVFEGLFTRTHRRDGRWRLSRRSVIENAWNWRLWCWCCFVARWESHVHRSECDVVWNARLSLSELLPF